MRTHEKRGDRNVRDGREKTEVTNSILLGRKDYFFFAKSLSSTIAERGREKKLWGGSRRRGSGVAEVSF